MDPNDLFNSQTATYLNTAYDPTSDPLASSNLTTGTATTSNIAGNSINTINSSYTYGSGINWGNFISSGSLSQDYYSFSEENHPLAKVILPYLTEEELTQLIEQLKIKSIPENEFQELITFIVKHRHCSEEFIMKYLKMDGLENSVLTMILYPYHKPEILSGEYAALAVLLQLK